MLHFDAHADTGYIEFGSLWGHGQPMGRLIELGALRGERVPADRAARVPAAADTLH
jgi:arginase family enzyme